MFVRPLIAVPDRGPPKLFTSVSARLQPPTATSELESKSTVEKRPHARPGLDLSPHPDSTSATTTSLGSARYVLLSDSERQSQTSRKGICRPRQLLQLFLTNLCASLEHENRDPIPTDKQLREIRLNYHLGELNRLTKQLESINGLIEENVAKLHGVFHTYGPGLSHSITLYTGSSLTI